MRAWRVLEYGEELHARLCGRFEPGVLRTVVGADPPFEELPSGLAAMEQRETVGRLVVRAGP